MKPSRQWRLRCRCGCAVGSPASKPQFAEVSLQAKTLSRPRAQKGRIFERGTTWEPRCPSGGERLQRVSGTEDALRSDSAFFLVREIPHRVTCGVRCASTASVARWCRGVHTTVVKRELESTSVEGVVLKRAVVGECLVLWTLRGADCNLIRLESSVAPWRRSAKTRRTELCPFW